MILHDFTVLSPGACRGWPGSKSLWPRPRSKNTETECLRPGIEGPGGPQGAPGGGDRKVSQKHGACKDPQFFNELKCWMKLISDRRHHLDHRTLYNHGIWASFWVLWRVEPPMVYKGKALNEVNFQLKHRRLLAAIEPPTIPGASHMFLPSAGTNEGLDSSGKTRIIHEPELLGHLVMISLTNHHLW